MLYSSFIVEESIYTLSYVWLGTYLSRLYGEYISKHYTSSFPRNERRYVIKLWSISPIVLISSYLAFLGHLYGGSWWKILRLPIRKVGTDPGRRLTDRPVVNPQNDCFCQMLFCLDLIHKYTFLNPTPRTAPSVRPQWQNLLHRI